MHEELVRGTLPELADEGVTELGEFTIVVARGEEETDAEEAVRDVDALIAERRGRC